MRSSLNLNEEEFYALVQLAAQNLLHFSFTYINLQYSGFPKRV